MSNKLDRFRFRVWDKADKEMSYPDYIYFGSEGMLKKIHINDNKNDNIPYSFECIEIMQCTGLKDKNGILIFDGDIVKTENHLSVVKYEIYDDAEGYSDFEHLGFNTTYNYKIFDK